MITRVLYRERGLEVRAREGREEAALLALQDGHEPRKADASRSKK